MDHNMSDFKETLQRLCIDEKGSHQFQEVNIEVIDDVHLMRNILDVKHCKLPFLLAYRTVNTTQVNHEVSADLSNVSTENPSKLGLNDSGSLDGSPLKLEKFQSIGIIGSPLKLQQFSTSSVMSLRSGKAISPATSDEGRDLIATYVEVSQELLFEESLKNVLPLWVVCDAKDVEHLACIATHVTYDKAARFCYVNSYTVDVQGPLEKKMLPKPLMMHKEHCWRAYSERFKVQSYAQYDIFGSGLKDKSEVEQQGSLTVRMFWDELKPLLSIPPHDSKAFVDVVVVAGDLRSAAHTLYCELFTLQGLVGGLKDGQITWCQEESDIPLLGKVITFLDDVKQGDLHKNIDEPEDDDDSLRNLVIVERKDLDFTEELWNVLKYSSSFKTLLVCMQHILSSLQNGEVQPMVNKSNLCELACLVRDSYYNKMVMPPLEGTKPLELLVEIGLEKLTRDYIDTLVGKDLVTVSHLDFFINTSKLEIPERIERLERLHHAVELAVVLEQFLRLPRLTIGTSTRQALKYFETHTTQEPHVFTIPVQASNVSSLIEKCNASVWKVELKSEVDQADVHSVYLITTKPALSHITHASHQPDKDESEETISYYLTTVKQSMTVI